MRSNLQRKFKCFFKSRGTSENILRHDENGLQIWKDQRNKFTFDKCAMLHDDQAMIGNGIRC